MKHQSIRAWSLATLAVLGAFGAAGILGAVVASWVGRWELPASGFAAALAVVITAYMTAPSKRASFACSGFVVGAITASWIFSDGSWYPESYGNLAYQKTYLPLWLTLAGGIVGLMCVFVLDRLQRRSSPNT